MTCVITTIYKTIEGYAVLVGPAHYSVSFNGDGYDIKRMADYFIPTHVGTSQVQMHELPESVQKIVEDIKLWH